MKNQYTPDKHALSFRAFVGIFSRIWPKDNVTNVRHPLHTVAGQAANECIATLIKIFERYKEIEEAHKKLVKKEEERKALRRAMAYSFVERISKRQYSENEVLLDQISTQVEEIKTDLAKYALNIRQVVDKELLELKKSKDRLLQQRLKTEENLSRTQRNLTENKYIQSEQFSSLVDFFPDVNTEKIAQIEIFHSSLARLLKKELTESKNILTAQQEQINLALKEIDAQISERLKNHENPTALVDHVYALSQQWNKLKREDELFEKQAEIENDFTTFKANLSALRVAILITIQVRVNKEIKKIVERVYGEGAKTPVLSLSENSYTFDIVDDTGTGKAYANLVIFDLAIFALTDLPILIHDTPLFKNVENQAVAKFINEYAGQKKQSFIALDEIAKYGSEAEKLLRDHQIVQLTNDSLCGQYPTGSSFLEHLSQLLRLRHQYDAFRNGLRCSRQLGECVVAPNLKFSDAVRENTNPNFRRLVLQWINSKGPFWDDDFEPLEDDYFQCVKEDITNLCIAEAARFIIRGRLAYSFNQAFTHRTHEIVADFFTGEKALFTDESDGNKSYFRKDLTFEDMSNPGQEKLYSWHGKIKTPQYRVHFSWPLTEKQEYIDIVYIGPKITKS